MYNMGQTTEQNNIERFVKAQDNHACYQTALSEVSEGRKRSHWIWFIFPQMRGLGYSEMSHYYGIASLNEAKAYLAHPTLNARQREICQALLQREETALQIFGGIDALKVQSSMTLFDLVAPQDIFAEVLDKFYGGERCQKTLELLGRL